MKTKPTYLANVTRTYARKFANQPSHAFVVHDKHFTTTNKHFVKESLSSSGIDIDNPSQHHDVRRNLFTVRGMNSPFTDLLLEYEGNKTKLKQAWTQFKKQHSGHVWFMGGSDALNSHWVFVAMKPPLLRSRRVSN